MAGENPPGPDLRPEPPGVVQKTIQFSEEVEGYPVSLDTRSVNAGDGCR